MSFFPSLARGEPRGEDAIRSDRAWAQPGLRAVARKRKLGKVAPCVRQATPEVARAGGGRGRGATLSSYGRSPWQKTTAWMARDVPHVPASVLFFHDFSTRVKILIRVEPQTTR